MPTPYRPLGYTAELAKLTAVILAGGLGTRLRSVVADKPKVLAQVRGRPHIFYVLDQLALHGICDVVLCIGYLGELVEDAVGDTYREIRVRYSREKEPLGTAGALRLALPLLGSDPVLVMNGDCLCHVDLSAFYEYHCRSASAATILLAHVTDTSRYGLVETDATGHILRFAEKEAAGRSGWVNAGMYLISLQLLEEIPETKAVSIERDMFPSWVGRSLYGYKSRGSFIDIGTPESYAAAADFLGNLNIPSSTDGREREDTHA